MNQKFNLLPSLVTSFLLEPLLARMSGMWSVVPNGFYFLEFVKGWKGGLRCMISYHKIDFCITDP